MNTGTKTLDEFTASCLLQYNHDLVLQANWVVCFYMTSQTIRKGFNNPARMGIIGRVSCCKNANVWSKRNWI